MSLLSGLGAAFLKVKGVIMATTATKVATVAVAATIVVGGTIGVTQTEVFASPEKKVVKALSSLVETEEGILGREIGWREFFDALSEKGAEGVFQMTLEDVPLDALGLSGIDIPNIGIDAAYRYDAKNSQMDMEVGAQVANTTLLSASLYVDEEKAIAAVPQLFEGFMGANYADSEFLEQFKNSELTTMLGEEFRAEIESLLESVQDEAQIEKMEQLQEEYRVAVTEDIIELLKSMEAEKLEPEEVTVAGETLECKVYEASFGAEDMELFVNSIIDETVAYYETYIEENADSLDEATKTAMEEWIAMYQAEVEEFQTMVAENEAEIRLKLYMKGKKLIQAVLQGVIEEADVVLTVTFAPEGNRYDNMSVTCGYWYEEKFVTLIELTHVTDKVENLISSEWKLVVEEEELLNFLCTYETVDGDFYVGLVMPGEDMTLEIEGVLTVPDRGKELAFELDDIRFAEYGESISLGYQTELSLKVLEEKITAPEEIKWDVVAMDAKAWSDLVNEITGNLYSIVMQLMFG